MKYKAVKIKSKKRDLHRVVMEEHLGYQLTRREVVHHKDGNPMNNDIGNLQVMSLSEHSRMHMLGNKNSHKNREILRIKGQTFCETSDRGYPYY